MRKTVLMVIYSTLFMLPFSCNRGKPKNINTDNIHIDLTIDRFENDLFLIDKANVKESLTLLKNKYEGFYEIYFNNILKDTSKDTLHTNTVLALLDNKEFVNLREDVLKKYPNLDELKLQLTEAFRRYKYYFPKKSVPKVITFISGFENAIVNIDGALAIGLDMFLGKDYALYAQIGFPKYIINRLSQDYMLPLAIQGFAKQEFGINDEDKTFLNQMIYEGKVLYFVDSMLPKIPEELKLGYTKEQLQWAKQYEPEIWANFIDEDILYTSDQKKYNKYLEDAPFSSGFYNNSAPRLAFFTGLQIVKSYMEENPNVSLQSLMEEQDPIKILNKSKYKPKLRK